MTFHWHLSRDIMSANNLRNIALHGYHRIQSHIQSPPFVAWLGATCHNAFENNTIPPSSYQGLIMVGNDRCQKAVREGKVDGSSMVAFSCLP